MTWTANDIPDQSGKVAVVTGANGGLGLETARELARKGAHVVMAARNLAKASTAEEDLRRSVPDASVEVLELDLGSLDSIRAFASTVLGIHPSIELMVNNAGVMATPRLETRDGFELQFGTNHLGHFALNALLMPAMLRGEVGRVVTVSSTARYYRWLYDRDDIHLKKRYTPWRSYGRSKIANVHFGIELDRRLRSAHARVQSLVAHPGLSSTDLSAASARLAAEAGVAVRRRGSFHKAGRRITMSSAEGALPQLRAATDPAAKGGQLYAPRWVANGPPVRRPLTRWSLNRRAMHQLWELSEELTGVSFAVDAMAATEDG
ncbi:MAG: oxidoreductase [Acidimicrobiia bacterium]|nr:oxidoreductase [Acidimicrobiia bacterium]